MNETDEYSNVLMEESYMKKTIRRIDKSKLTGLTAEKKRMIRAGKGAASCPIDFNKMRDEEKYGKG